MYLVLSVVNLTGGFLTENCCWEGVGAEAFQAGRAGSGMFGAVGGGGAGVSRAGSEYFVGVGCYWWERRAGTCIIGANGGGGAGVSRAGSEYFCEGGLVLVGEAGWYLHNWY